MKEDTWVVAAPFFVLWLTQGNPAYLAVAGLWLAVGAGVSIGEHKREKEDRQA